MYINDGSRAGRKGTLHPCQLSCLRCLPTTVCAGALPLCATVWQVGPISGTTGIAEAEVEPLLHLPAGHP